MKKENNEIHKVPAGYKQTEIGVIPDEWDVVNIGSLCTIFGRIGYRGYTKADIVSSDVGVLSISPSNIFDGKLDYSNGTYITLSKYHESPEIKIYEGDVLLVKTGSTYGKIGLVKGLEQKATLNPQVVVLKNRKCPDALLAYLMQFDLVKNQIEETIVGGAIPTLSQKEVSDYLVPIASNKQEQTAIANALSDVDALIAELEKLIAKKEAIKTGAMQQLLTGRTRLPQFTKQEDGTPKGYKQSELGEIPEDWSVVRLGDIGETIIGLTYSPNDVAESGTLVLRSSNVQNGKLSYKDNVFVEMNVPNKVIVQEGDILICVRNGSRQLIGKCALIDAKVAGSAFGAFMSVFRTNLSSFVFYQFQSNIIQNQINEVMGATINQITNKNMSSFLITLPQNEIEKIAIAEILSDMDLEIEALEKRLDKIKVIKQGMMQELLTGRTRLV